MKSDQSWWGYTGGDGGLSRGIFGFFRSVRTGVLTSWPGAGRVASVWFGPQEASATRKDAGLGFFGSLGLVASPCPGGRWKLRM